MTEFKSLIDEVSRLVTADTAGLPELHVKMVELDDFVHSGEFDTLNSSERARFQAAYKELKEAIRRLENPVSQPGGPAGPGFETSLGEAPSARPAEAVESREHNPFAEQQMEEAEKLFYGGRYAEAIKLYDQVLLIEPKWERARQHRSESENYLRTGYIPSVALPAEAASAFGKAQSAARLGRYVDAMSMLNRAQAALREMGIQRWQDGQEFEQKLQQYIDAESVYGEGLQLFSKGMIDDGIERVDTAAQATGLPKYNDRAMEMRKAKAAMQAIAETLNTAFAEPKDVVQVKTSLDALTLQYGDNPAFQKLKERLQAIIPLIVEPLKDQVRALKTQAERSQTLDAVTAKARQARLVLDQARSLGYQDETLSQLQGDLEKLFSLVQRYEDELQQAITIFNSNRSWPAAAWQVSQDVRARYPNDPRVIELTRSLGPYRNSRLAIRAGLVGLAILIIVGLIMFGLDRVQAYIISLTPTATATATLTATATPAPPTVTLTPAPTLTATITLTPTRTATPPSGIVAREIWVRNGCYETFRAIGQIPAGTQVRFMPVERAFDNIGRECLLIQYTAEDKTTVAGWILVADIGK